MPETTHIHGLKSADDGSRPLEYPGRRCSSQDLSPPRLRKAPMRLAVVAHGGFAKAGLVPEAAISRKPATRIPEFGNPSQAFVQVIRACVPAARYGKAVPSALGASPSTSRRRDCRTFRRCS